MNAVRQFRAAAPIAGPSLAPPGLHPAVPLMAGRSGGMPRQTALPALPPARNPPGERLDANGCILAIARSADRQAFAALFEYFAPRIKTYLQRQGVAAPMADDLAQETMLAVWRKAPSFDPQRAGAATWIFTIARNLRIDALRRDRRQDPQILPDGEAATEPGAERALLASEEDDLLRTAVLSLPPDQGLVIQLSFFRGLPHVEIERLLGIPLGTVKSRLRLAMARLRTALEASR